MSRRPALRRRPPITLHSQHALAGLNRIPSLRMYLDDSGKSYPSVTSILSKSNRSDSLRVWKERMIEKMGVEGFNKMQTETLNCGTETHALIQDYLSQTNSVSQDEPLLEHSPSSSSSSSSFPTRSHQSDGDDFFDHDNAVIPNVEEYSERVQGLWESVFPVLQELSRVDVIESSVFHPTLGYAGTIDCIAEHQGEQKIIDWKTAKRRKRTLHETFDNPLQLAAYLGALHSDQRYPDTIRPVSGMIVVMYEDAPATCFTISKSEMEGFWSKWLERYADFQFLSENGLTPL